MITLDGFGVLKSIGTSKKAFAIVEAEVEKAADSIMKKVLKAKGLSVPQLREVCRAVGSESMALVIDNLADKEVSGLVSKFDKLWPQIKIARIPEQREHILSFANGRIDPTIKISGVSVAQMREVCRAAGTDALERAIDNLADEEVVAVLKKIDKYWPQITTASMQQRRKHVASIAAGRSDPTAKPPAAPKKAPKASASWTASMGARPPR